MCERPNEDTFGRSLSVALSDRKEPGARRGFGATPFAPHANGTHGTHETYVYPSHKSYQSHESHRCDAVVAFLLLVPRF
jgi:hypothetical protein